MNTETSAFGKWRVTTEVMDANQISTYYAKKQTIKNVLSDFSPENIDNLKDIEQICKSLSSLYNTL